MSQWATRRQLTYGGGLLALIVLLAVLFIVRSIQEPATCFDGVQNQGETAIDQGGPCDRLNPDELRSAVVLWTQGVRVTSDVYNLVAVVENIRRRQCADQRTHWPDLYRTKSSFGDFRGGCSRWESYSYQCFLFF